MKDSLIDLERPEISGEVSSLGSSDWRRPAGEGAKNSLDNSSVRVEVDDHLTVFRQAMESYDLHFKDELVGDGRIHRIHIEGDKPGSRNGWYLLHLDGKPAGVFGCKKRLGDEKIKWTAQGTKPLTREEKRALAEKAAADKARRAAEEAAMHAAAARQAVANWNAGKPDLGHPYLDRKGVPNYGLRVGDYVKDWTNPETGEVTTIRVPNSLLVPLYVSKNEIVSMQAIFQAERNGRDKDFLPGGRKRGCYFMIGKPLVVEGKPWVAICEGYATGASIHRATNLGVLVAFDAGNLQPVAEKLRAALPAVGILIAADNDCWTTTPIQNPGVTRARQAADAVGGRVAIPDFASLEGKPTDFNDLDQREGSGQVLQQIIGTLSTTPKAAAKPALVEPTSIKPSAEEPPVDEAPPNDGGDDDAGYDPDFDYQPLSHGNEPSGPISNNNPYADIPAGPDSRRHFVVLGHDKHTIWIYQVQKMMIVDYHESHINEAGLTSMAPLQWWQQSYPTDMKKSAIDWLQQMARARGYFNPAVLRHRGAWVDDKRMVFHFGRSLEIDGVPTGLPDVKSDFVYQQCRPLVLPAPDRLSNEDGRRLFDIAKGFRWTRRDVGDKDSASAILLIGWTVLAPLCGALKWRPHIWVTGGPGSGKTTLLNFVAWILNGYLLYAQGASTEAGIRQELAGDALPVLFDESESNNDREASRISAVLALTRQASSETGARTMKGTTGGTAMHFLVRSMFCLSSIQVSIKQQADRERFVRLELRGKKTDATEANSASNWERLEAMIKVVMMDEKLPARLMRRSLDLLPTTLENVRTFSRAAAVRFGSQRFGDQYGPLLAGAWSLMSNKLVSLPEAEQIIDRYKWEEYTEGNDEEEADHALGALLAAPVRLQSGLTLSVSELVSLAAGMHVEAVETIKPKEAGAILTRNGMRVEGVGRKGELWLSNNFLGNPHLIAGTSFFSDLKGQLSRIQGAKRGKNPAWFTSKVRYLSIPLEHVINEDARELSVDPALYGHPPV